MTESLIIIKEWADDCTLFNERSMVEANQICSGILVKHTISWHTSMPVVRCGNL